MIGQLVHLGVVPWASPFICLGRTDLGLALASTLGSSRRRARGGHYARISKPWSWGYAALWGLTFLTVRTGARIAEIDC